MTALEIVAAVRAAGGKIMIDKSTGDVYAVATNGRPIPPDACLALMDRKLAGDVLSLIREHAPPKTGDLGHATALDALNAAVRIAESHEHGEVNAA